MNCFKCCSRNAHYETAVLIDSLDLIRNYVVV